MFGVNRNSSDNMLQQILNFSRNVSNPEAALANYLKNNHISQEQLSEAINQAKQLASILNLK